MIVDYILVKVLAVCEAGPAMHRLAPPRWRGALPTTVSYLMEYLVHAVCVCTVVWCSSARGSRSHTRAQVPSMRGWKVWILMVRHDEI